MNYSVVSPHEILKNHKFYLAGIVMIGASGFSPVSVSVKKNMIKKKVSWKEKSLLSIQYQSCL
jgi:hypothetical protein